MNGRKAGALAAWVVMIGAGCGNSDVPFDEYGARSTETLCNVLRDCYGETVIRQLVGDECAADLLRNWEQQQGPQLEQAIADGSLVYDGTRVEPCLDQIEASGCGVVDRAATPECDAVLVGTIAAGGACSIEEQCAGDSFCRIDTMCPGTCQARVASGSACGASGECQAGLRCAGGTCQAAAGLAANCEGETGLPCAGGLICFGGTPASIGMPAVPSTCRTIDSVFSANVGDLCNPQGGPLCVEGSTCALTGVSGGTTPVFECQAPVAAGAACRLSVPEQCPSGQLCTGVTPMLLDFEGTCAPLPGAGDPCERNLCADGLRCDGTTCRPVSNVGGACESAADCFSASCDGGVCVEAMLCAE